jgi:hypothetical protein
MIEVIFGIFIGLAYSMFFPNQLKRIKEKIKYVVLSEHECEKKK